MPQEEIRRTSPDVFLRLIEKSRRGKLKIYIGHAAGVGKTYQMLEDAHALKKQGVDVVVGLVETHGRAETAERIGDLEVIPRRAGRLQGQARSRRWTCRRSCARKPEVVIVDELAHTNVPGTENAKRYQDVEDLLEAGISVMTTVNIQHFESLQDIVSRVTGVDVQERVPDRHPPPGRHDRQRGPAVGRAPGASAGRQDLPGRAHRPGARELLHRGEPRLAAGARDAADRRPARGRAPRPGRVRRDRAGRHQGHGRHVLQPRNDAAAAAPRLGAGGQAQHELVRRLRAHAPREPAADVGPRAPAAVRERDARHGARRQGRLALGEDVAGELLRFAREHGVTLAIFGKSRLPMARRLVRKSPIEAFAKLGTGIDVYEIETTA